MSIAGKIAEFMLECPLLKEFEQMFPKVDLDNLEEDTAAYCIESTPADPILRRFTNGDSMRQYVFSFCSREWYSPEDNQDTSEFYEKFADWLEECTDNGTLPQLSGKLQSKSIKATTGGYLYDAQENKCQYRIQCQFIYYKRR